MIISDSTDFLRFRRWKDFIDLVLTDAGSPKSSAILNGDLKL